MYSLILLFVVSITISSGYSQGNDNSIGPGKWSVLSVSKCEDPDQYIIMADVRRAKINRTHDAFSVLLDLDMELDQTIGAKMTVEKECDGGYKLYQEIADESFCNLVTKYAKANFEKALQMIEIDPPNCPLPPGQYNLVDFCMDYNELPGDAVYGKFKVRARLVKENAEIACVLVDLQFKEEDDDYDDE